MENGAKLLQQLENNGYDCILIDKNMPGLYGIEIAGIIRKLESKTGQHTPLVAVTASAIAGDKEILIDAGMDYYLSKPIKEKDLLAILKQVHQQKVHQQKTNSGNNCPGAAGDEQHADNEQHADSLEFRFIDHLVLLDEAGLFGKDAMLAMIDSFLKDYKNLMEKVAIDLQTGNCVQLEKSAHKLAGSVSAFYAQKLYHTTQRIETNARKRELKEAAKAFNEFSLSIDSFIGELQAIKEKL